MRGTQAAFLADQDTSKGKQRFFCTLLLEAGGDSAALLPNTSTVDFPQGWLVSEHRCHRFPQNGERLFFGTAPIPMAEDTTMNDEVTPKLDIWSWEDDSSDSAGAQPRSGAEAVVSRGARPGVANSLNSPAFKFRM
jgi:hypothetical protein